MDFSLNFLDQVKGLGNWVGWLLTDCTWQVMAMLALLVLMWGVGLVPGIRSHYVAIVGMMAGSIFFMRMIENSDIPQKSVDPHLIRCMISIILPGLTGMIYMTFFRRKNERGEWETQTITKDNHGT